MSDRYEQIEVSSREQWREWLASHHMSSPGVWVVTVERLQQAGLMTPAGQAAIETAKHDGTWSALDEVENLLEPDDLRAALDADQDARRYRDAFPRSTKRGILEWILNAKKPETRERRITETTRLAAQGLRANQPRQPKRRSTDQPG